MYCFFVFGVTLRNRIVLYSGIFPVNLFSITEVNSLYLTCYYSFLHAFYNIIESVMLWLSDEEQRLWRHYSVKNVYFRDIYCEVGVCLQLTDLITWGQMNVTLAWLASDFSCLFLSLLSYRLFFQNNHKLDWIQTNFKTKCKLTPAATVCATHVCLFIFDSLFNKSLFLKSIYNSLRHSLLSSVARLL